MAFTYDPSTKLGMVRMMIGDTNSISPIFQDNELNALLTLYVNINIASAYALDAIAASASRLARLIKNENYTTDDREVAENLRTQATKLRSLAVVSPVVGCESPKVFVQMPWKDRAGSESGIW